MSTGIIESGYLAKPTAELSYLSFNSQGLNADMEHFGTRWPVTALAQKCMLTQKKEILNESNIST